MWGELNALHSLAENDIIIRDETDKILQQIITHNTAKGEEDGKLIVTSG